MWIKVSFISHCIPNSWTWVEQLIPWSQPSIHTHDFSLPFSLSSLAPVKEEPGFSPTPFKALQATSSKIFPGVFLLLSHLENIRTCRRSSNWKRPKIFISFLLPNAKAYLLEIFFFISNALVIIFKYFNKSFKHLKSNLCSCLISHVICNSWIHWRCWSEEFSWADFMVSVTVLLISWSFQYNDSESSLWAALMCTRWKQVFRVPSVLWSWKWSGTIQWLL